MASAKDNISLSFGIQGMERQNFQHQLDEKVFTFQRNGNLETDDESIGLTNEHSNLLCSRFKPGYIVIGTKYDSINNKVYFFLTEKNKDADGKRKSEIGFIKFNREVTDIEDIENECGCDFSSTLAEPLENVDQIPYCKYETLLSDECNNCLNFDPNYPVKDIVLKQEACGFTMTFASKNNPPRYINMSDLDVYKHTGSVNCGVDNREDTCLDCEKLRVFPLYEKPYIRPVSISHGGRLRRGIYEFYIAYCDKYGNELTPYVSATNPVQIFDINNRELSQATQYDYTTFAIRLKIDSIDNKFNFYKIAVIERADVSQIVGIFEEGIHPITDTNVLYTSNGKESSAKRITLQHIFAEKAVYKNWGGITEANGYLIAYDYEVEKEWNLQPMVNLMGTFLKWQTVESTENLYKDGINISDFRSYMRDEVYPIGIRFRSNIGYKTAVFPFMGRPALTSDLTKYSKSTNKDIASILNNSPECDTTNREHKWQYYNTASILGNSYSEIPTDRKTKIVERIIREECIQEDVAVVENGKLEIPIDEEFIGLSEWINEHGNEVCDDKSEYYNADLCEIIKSINHTDCDTSNLFPFPLCNGTDCTDGTCDEPIAVSEDGSESKIRIGQFINERTSLVPKIYPWEPNPNNEPTYLHSSSDSNCVIFGGSAKNRQAITYNVEFETTEPRDVKMLDIYQRNDDIMINTACENYSNIPSTFQFFKVNYSGFLLTEFKHWTDRNLTENMGWFNKNKKMYHINNKYDNYDIVDIKTDMDDINWAKANLLTNIRSTPHPEYEFEPFINTEALWYEVNFAETPEYLLEVTPVNALGNNRDAFSFDGMVRYSIYDKCKNGTLLESGLYDSKEGLFKQLKRSQYKRNTILIAIDTPVRKVYGQMTYQVVAGDRDQLRTTYHFYCTSSPSGCFNILFRPVEYYKAIVEFDKLTLNKSTLFESNCRFTVPANLDCGVIPHKYGMFAYWESTEKYPDNGELYDSSSFKLDISKLSHEDKPLTNLFKSTYIQSIDSNGNAVWKKDNSGKSKVNFTCENIRHPKFPDNSIVPYMSTEFLADFSESKIFPLGVTINDKTINAFLDMAVVSNLISKEERDSIIGYELLRGDRTVNKSIIYKGLLNDMYEDPYEISPRQKTFFRNFPYNTLGKNAFICSDVDRSKLLAHPFANSDRNNRFSLIAPEVYYSRPNLPSEMVIDGYLYGSAQSGFVESLDHSKWVILGDKAVSQAGALAKAEIAMETALNIATMSIQSSQNQWFMAGISSGGGFVGTAVSIAAIAIFKGIQATQLATFKYPKLKVQWLQTFEDRGSAVNFAYQQVSNKGFYNYFKPLLSTKRGNMIRGLVTSRYLNNGLEAITEIEGSQSKVTVINNKDRETSVYLYTGDAYPIQYPDEYLRYDNYDTSPRNASRYISSDDRCSANIKGIKRIASPYVTLRSYFPDQYGKIDEIKWLSINHDHRFTTTPKNIFGGDTFISRVDLKTKTKLFNKNAIRIADRVPFKYSKTSNIGYTRFYVDYKSSDEDLGSLEMPYLNTKHNMDCHRNTRVFYEGGDSKFYLYSYGVPYFLVESDINCNFRYSGKEYHEKFASTGLNVEDWTQEANVSIAFDNIFYYNNAYSIVQSGMPFRILPSYYEKAKWDCLSEAENGVAWSGQDNSEVSLSDPWLTFKPFDIYRFNFAYGKLIGLSPLESNQVMGRFENNMTIFNAIDVLRDRVTPESEELGTGGMFAQRPIQFSYTELGETGSQHRSMVSCEFGHFWTDAKRGKIFQLQPNGQGLSQISDFRGGKGDESGMRKWFKKHLPFKILRQGIENLTEKDIDNPYKGLGILMWWDSRFKRIFVTKRDYIAKSKNLMYSGGEFYVKVGNQLEHVELTNTTYFKDVSWTVAYSPIYQSWISYYDFKPDYAIAYNDYFQTGLNYSNDSKEQGLWSHLLTNKSYQVFYGKYYPWEIEIPIKNNYVNNVLQDLQIWTISKRYHNDYDYAVWRKKSFNKVNIYNQTNNSGILNLDYVDTYIKSQYPKFKSSTEQIIPATHFEEQIKLNYFYNRVKREEAHLPIWNWDENEINKQLNDKTISFTSKKVLERIRGDWFFVHLIQDSTSQFKHYFKWMMSTEKPYKG